MKTRVAATRHVNSQSVSIRRRLRVRYASWGITAVVAIATLWVVAANLFSAEVSENMASRSRQSCIEVKEGDMTNVNCVPRAVHATEHRALPAAAADEDEDAE